MSEVARPGLWSDLDGTAVRKFSWRNPRNWTKYPLPIIEGYLDFLNGVRQGGVDVDGLISRRPDILPRRLATNRSIAKLGMMEFFGQPGQVVLTGGERKKGMFLVEKSVEKPIGVVEDRPHNLVPIVLGVLGAAEVTDTPRHLTIGAVAHARTEAHMDVVADITRAQQPEVEVVASGAGLRVEGPGFKLNIVTLQPYSVEAGQAFAETLHAA